MTALTTIHDIKVGDIFYSSWGYDQTNIDFYEVVGVTPSGLSAKFQPIDAKVISSTGYQDELMPVPGTGGDRTIMTKRVNNRFDTLTVRMSSYHSAYKWDGKSKYQTGYGFGH